MKNIFSIVLFALPIVMFGQKKNSNEDLILFEKTVAIQELIDEELNDAIFPDDTANISAEEKIKGEFAQDIKETILTKVIENYEELIDNFPKSKLVFRALNNKGYAELQLKEYDEAKKTFTTLLNSKADDSEKGGIGSGLMGEPYANYKNRASKILADIELRDYNYSQALKYLDETKKYPYRHFCGNEYAAEELYMAVQYSKCYLGLNQSEKAYDLLLPNILGNGLASNTQLIEVAYNALLQQYQKEDLKSQFEKSFQNVIIEKETNTKNQDTFYYINFLRRKIQLDSWSLHDMLSEEEREKVIADILKTSEFYILLSK